MPDTLEEKWEAVAEVLKDADAITWDECHKIYISMDPNQTQVFQGFGYDTEHIFEDSIETLRDWYEKSCFLRFVSAVRTTDKDEDRNKGFTQLIEQGAEDE